MKKILLKDIAHARSGDKGNTVNIGVFALEPEYYALLLEQLTSEKLKTFFNGMVFGDVVRYKLPNINGLNFVLKDALDGGGASSMRVDNLGKCFGSNILRFEVEVPASLNVN